MRARGVRQIRSFAHVKEQKSMVMRAERAPGAQKPARINSRYYGLTWAAWYCVQGDLVNVDAAFFFLPIFWSILAKPSIFTSSLFLTRDRRLVYSGPASHFIPVLLVYMAVTYISLPGNCGLQPQRGNGVLVYL